MPPKGGFNSQIMKKTCKNCSTEYIGNGNQQYCTPKCRKESYLKRLIEEEEVAPVKVYPKIEALHSGFVFLKLYRINKEAVVDGKIKLFVNLHTDGKFTVDESLTGTPLGKGKLFDRYDPPKTEEQWNGVIFVRSIITEFLSDGGTVKLAFLFQHYDDGTDKMKITQMVPKEAIERYDTKIGHGSCRNKKVSDIKNWIEGFKEE